MFPIPLTSEPIQTVRCVIPVDGKNLPLNFTLKFNSEAGYWVMSLSNDNGDLLIDSLPLIAGVFPSANLLGQYGFLRIGSCVMVRLNPDNPDVMPNGNNLGTDFSLMWSNTIYE